MSEGIFQKLCEITVPQLFVEKFRNSDFSHFVWTKLKIPSEIKAPLLQAIIGWLSSCMPEDLV